MFKSVIAIVCVFMPLVYGSNSAPFSTLGAQPKNGGMRIFKLLPGLNEMTPLVEPFLPESFVSVCEKGGALTYYWGNRKDIRAYTNDPSTLTGMLLKVNIANNAYQLGHDRFSMDGRYERWMASGFSQILAKKGKWGIFPTREIKMKGPKKREHYKLWVGLNNKSKQVLTFELIYPGYLKAPAEPFKRIWKQFVKKTTLLKPHDLMIAYGQGIHKGYTDIKGISEVVRIKAYKRLSDHKLFVHIVTPMNSSVLVDLRSIEDNPPFYGDMLAPGFITLNALLVEAGEKREKQSIKVYYETCEEFPFALDFLSLGRFLKNSNPQAIVFQN